MFDILLGIALVGRSCGCLIMLGTCGAILCLVLLGAAYGTPVR